MGKLRLFMLLTLAGVFSQAALNPQMRACRVAKGQFFSVDTGLDMIGLCRVGPSFIGAADLLNKGADVEDAPSSLVDYKNGVEVCASNRIVTFPNPAGSPLKACYYDDGSIIDLMTMSRGRHHPLNMPLNHALGLY